MDFKKKFVAYLKHQNQYIINYLNSVDIENALNILISYLIDFEYEQQKFSFKTEIQNDDDLSTQKNSIIDILSSDDFQQLIKDNAKRLSKKGKSTFLVALNSIFYSIKDIVANIEAIKKNKSRNAKPYILLLASQLYQNNNKKITNKTKQYLSGEALKLAEEKNLEIENVDDLLKLKNLCEFHGIDFYITNVKKQTKKEKLKKQLSLF